MSKTKKKLIITFSIIGAFVVLLIVFGAFFSLRNIYVDSATSLNRASAYEESDIIEASGIKKGKNLIFMNFDKATQKLEKKFPYAKFEIIRTFPNKVTIYVSERTPAFRIEVGGVWHIYDEELKCLEIVTTPMLAENNNIDIPVLTLKSGFDFTAASEVGDKVNNAYLQSTISSIFGGIVYGAKSDMTIMSDITLEYNDVLGCNVATFVVSKTGTKIVVQGSSYLYEKVASGLALYLRNIRQYDPSVGGINHTGHLDKVTITVFSSFNPNNQQNLIDVNCEEEKDAGV